MFNEVFLTCMKTGLVRDFSRASTKQRTAQAPNTSGFIFI